MSVRHRTIWDLAAETLLAEGMSHREVKEVLRQKRNELVKAISNESLWIEAIPKEWKIELRDK